MVDSSGNTALTAGAGSPIPRPPSFSSSLTTFLLYFRFGVSCGGQSWVVGGGEMGALMR